MWVPAAAAGVGWHVAGGCVKGCWAGLLASRCPFLAVEPFSACLRLGAAPPPVSLWFNALTQPANLPSTTPPLDRQYHPGLPISPLQLKGYAAAPNARGTVFLETIGIDPADLTRDIVVTDCFYLALVGLPALVHNFWV